MERWATTSTGRGITTSRWAASSREIPYFSLQSLYSYCANSPINFTDPMGATPIRIARYDSVCRQWDPNAVYLTLHDKTQEIGPFPAGPRLCWQLTLHLERHGKEAPPQFDSEIDYNGDGYSGEELDDFLAFIDYMDYLDKYGEGW